jgi:preprotein translocase subunit SecB
MTNPTEGKTEGKGDGNGTGDGGAAPTAEAPPPPLTINAQYVRDLSFEAPSAPQVFALMQRNQPDLAINVDVQARSLEGNVYEVVINVRAECKVAGTLAFLVECAYGGVFTLNVRPEDLRPVLLIECPRLLFPFARQVVASTTTNGGFLPLMLGPVDFASLYQREMEKEAEAADAKLV